ncbi:MAG: SPOR domain-containing protein [Saprospiraceae bacterium]|nr:SPOR domain-containing protein [Saprospiraceae bacterium]
MSRLDYFTVAIVAICILAIVFLLYRTTDLFKTDKPVDLPPRQEEMVEDTMDAEVINPEDYDPEYTGESASDSTEVTEGASANPVKTETEEEPAEGYEDLYKAGGGTGNYLVLAGSFEYRHNADNQAKRLKGLGYSESEVVLFNRGKYATVLVSRFDQLSEANALVTRLSGQNVEAYVHEKRMKAN